MKPDEILIEEICNEYSGKDKDLVREIVEKAFKKKNEEFVKTHKPIYEMENFKQYHRTLIQLRPDIVMLIHLFHRDMDDTFETITLNANDGYYEADYECIKESAKQLLHQLEGHYCDLFIETLRDECNKILEESEKRKKALG